MNEERGLAPYTPPAEAGVKPSNPVHAVRDAMATRWRWFALIALPVGLLAAVAGYLLAPVMYSASATIKIESKPESLFGAGAQLEQLNDPTSYIQNQAILLQDPSLLQFVVQWAQEGLSRATLAVAGRDRAAELRQVGALIGRERGTDPVGVLESGLSVITLKGTTILQVRFVDTDPKVPAAVVNSLVDAYMENRIPDAETEFTRRTQEMRDVLSGAMRAREAAEAERDALLRDSPFGTAALDPLIAERVDRLERIRRDIAAIEGDQRRIVDSMAGEPRADEAREPPETALVEPSMAELESISPELARMRNDLETRRSEFRTLAARYRPGHSVFERAGAELRALESQYESMTEASRVLWRERTGQTRTYGELRRRAQQLQAEAEVVRGEVNRLNEVAARLAQADRRVESALAQERDVGEMLSVREMNARSMREGRISITQWASPPTLPESDKRVQVSMVAGIMGVLVVFGGFFLWGRLLPRAFSMQQFSAPESPERLLGPLPDMTGAPVGKEAHDLVTNCVHRLRNKIESRRTQGDGYAIMVSSPLQGDGKTTVAMALATSYAASGQSTVLVDCDFIGRALSHQYRFLHARGVREVLRRGAIQDEIYPTGIDGLSIMPNGVDVSFSAANLQTIGLRRLLQALRERFQIVIVDSGPMTASVEAQPVAASCDGAVLTIRRSRLRSKIPECIAMIRENGGEYLGLVLNYAEYGECLNYGSISKMSTDVARALEDRSASPASHPVLEAMRDSVQPFAVEAARTGETVLIRWLAAPVDAAVIRVFRSDDGGTRWREVAGPLQLSPGEWIDAGAPESRGLRYMLSAETALGVEVGRTQVVEVVSRVVP